MVAAEQCKNSYSRFQKISQMLLCWNSGSKLSYDSDSSTDLGHMGP